MIEWAALAIAGTLASGLARQGGKLLETAAGGIVEGHGDKLFCRIVGSIAEKFTTNSPPENHELVKAFRRACVTGMRHVCARRKTSIGSDTSPSFISRSRELFLGAAPTSLLGEDEKQWLEKAEKYLQNRIVELDRNLVWLPEPPSEKYRMLVVPSGVTNAERADEFRLTLTNDAVAELSQQVGPPPKGFVEEMEAGWFGLVGNEFQDAIARNPLLANKFQNQTLVEIKSDTGEIKFTLAEMMGLLRELTGKREQPAQAFVLNLPNLKVDVYDRVEETAKVLRALLDDDEQFHLVVAPSGFGKTFLLTKVLQAVTDGTVILPAYEKKVQRIALLDCRGTKTLAKVVGDFADLLGVNLEYAPQADEKPKEWLNKHLFPALRQAGTVWLVLENFEAWLDGEKGFTVKEPEMLALLNALFEGNHTLRVLCFSQAEPTPDIKKRFRQPPNVGEELFKGLPEPDALHYLRTEGANVGLDHADEGLLKKFLRRVARIPQALNSLVGYLETIEDYGFAEFMDDTALWEGFDAYEHESDEQDEGKRRSKALVAKQISAQSEDVKLLLMALAFFGKPIPREALEILFNNKTQAAQAISRLTAHRLATMAEDARGSKYYELHAYFREQARKVLPLLESQDESALDSYASNLAFVEGTKANNNAYFRRAFDLCECAEKIYNFLFEQKGRASVEVALVNTYENKGSALQSSGRPMEAIAEHDKAIAIRERLVNEEGRSELANDSATVYVNKGNALLSSGRLPEAIAEYDKAISIREQMVNQEWRGKLANELATAYTNKGAALRSSGKLEEAIAEHDKAILIRERLVNEEGQGELAKDLAAAYVNKGNALHNSRRPREAITENDKAIAIFGRLVNEEGHGELTNELAAAYMNKALALEDTTDWENSLVCYKEAIRLRIQCVHDYGRIEILPNLIRAICYRFDTLFKLERWDEAGQDAATAIRLLQDYLEHPELSDHLKARTLEEFGRIVNLLRQSSRPISREFYQAAGEYGEALRQRVEAS